MVADDRDYIPLFTKLREIGKTVIGIGSSKDSTQKYSLGACDHFYYHDSLTRSKKLMPEEGLSEFNGRSKEAEDEIIALFIEATKAVEAKGRSPFGSNIAPMMRSLKSDLDFEDYGFSGCGRWPPWPRIAASWTSRRKAAIFPLPAWIRRLKSTLSPAKRAGR